MPLITLCCVSRSPSFLTLNYYRLRFIYKWKQAPRFIKKLFLSNELSKLLPFQFCNTFPHLLMPLLAFVFLLLRNIVLNHHLYNGQYELFISPISHIFYFAIPSRLFMNICMSNGGLLLIHCVFWVPLLLNITVVYCFIVRLKFFPLPFHALFLFNNSSKTFFNN